MNLTEFVVSISLELWQFFFVSNPSWSARFFLWISDERFQNRSRFFAAFSGCVWVVQNQIRVGVSGDRADGWQINSGLQHSCYCRVSGVVGDKTAANVCAVSDAGCFGGFSQNLVVFRDGVSRFWKNEFADCSALLWIVGAKIFAVAEDLFGARRYFEIANCFRRVETGFRADDLENTRVEMLLFCCTHLTRYRTSQLWKKQSSAESDPPANIA